MKTLEDIENDLMMFKINPNKNNKAWKLNVESYINSICNFSNILTGASLRQIVELFNLQIFNQHLLSTNINIKGQDQITFYNIFYCMDLYIKISDNNRIIMDYIINSLENSRKSVRLAPIESIVDDRIIGIIRERLQNVMFSYLGN